MRNKLLFYDEIDIMTARKFNFPKRYQRNWILKKKI